MGRLSLPWAVPGCINYGGGSWANQGGKQHHVDTLLICRTAPPTRHPFIYLSTSRPLEVNSLSKTQHLHEHINNRQRNQDQ